MKRPDKRTTDAPEEPQTAPHLSGLIDTTLARFTGDWFLFRTPVGLQFPEELEAMYEVETCKSRVRELRITVSAAIAFMCLTTVTDATLVPDLGWQGLYLRLLASVVLICAVVSFDRLSGSYRELVLTAALYLAILVMASIPLISHAALAPYGLFVWMLAVIYCNTTMRMRFRYALPFSVVCLVTTVLLVPVSGRIGKDLSDSLAFLAVAGTSFSLVANYRMERTVRMGYLLSSKEALRLFALNRDRDQLATISSTDALTGVANRGHFDRRLETLFGGSIDTGTKIGLVLLDVDYFKRYNDHYGHPAGDACLKSVASVLTRVMRGKKDFGFRYGGEEFGALLLDVSRGTTESIAERIRVSIEREAIEHADREDGLKIVTVSVGVASAVVGDGTTADDLIKRADASLYAAKKAGRNRTVVLPR